MHLGAGAAFCLALTVPSHIVAAQAPATTSSPPTVDVGLGRGVTIRSADDEVSLNLRARIQVRSTVIGGTGENQDPLSEISIRRARLVLQGNALGPTLTYYLQLSFANLENEADLRVPLRDAYVTWAPSKSVNVRLGQMKVPFSRQRVTSSSALQMVDRSIVVTELNLDRDVGLQLFSRALFGGKVGYTLGLFGGEGRNRLGIPATIASRSGWGAYLQGGWMLSNRWEVSARYSHLAPSDGTDATFIMGDELGGALSLYLRDHNLKIQGDYFTVTDPMAARRVHQVRVQFQLFF